MKMFFKNKTWPEIQSSLRHGANGYFMNLGTGWIQVVVPKEYCECEFPTAEELATLPDDIKRMYQPQWEEELRSLNLQQWDTIGPVPVRIQD